MRRARIRVEIRLEIDHLLVRVASLLDASLFEQHVAQQPVIEEQPALRDDLSCQHLCFAEAVELMQDVAAHQERLRVARVLRLDTQCGLFRHHVVRGTLRRPRPGDELLRELVERGDGIRSIARTLLRPGNSRIDRPLFPGAAPGP